MSVWQPAATLLLVLRGMGTVLPGPLSGTHTTDASSFVGEGSSGGGERKYHFYER